MECCQNRVFFVGVTKMYINRRVYLCNAIMVTVIYTQQLVTLLRNNIFKQSLVIFLVIYWGLIV